MTRAALLEPARRPAPAAALALTLATASPTASRSTDGDIISLAVLDTAGRRGRSARLR